MCVIRRWFLAIEQKIRAERTQYEWQTSFCVYVNVFCAQMKIRLITICQLWRSSFQTFFSLHFFYTMNAAVVVAGKLSRVCNEIYFSGKRNLE